MLGNTLDDAVNITADIGKATVNSNDVPSIPQPGALTATYGQTLSQVTG